MKKHIYLKKEIFYICFTLLLMLNYCDPADNKLIITNNTNKPIYFYYTCNNSLDDLYINKNEYKKDSIILFSAQYIKPKSDIKVLMMGWPNPWKKYLIKNKYLYVFIFSEDIIRKFPIDSVKKHELFIKKFRYTLEELEKNKWVIIFDVN